MTRHSQVLLTVKERVEARATRGAERVKAVLGTAVEAQRKRGRSDRT